MSTPMAPASRRPKLSLSIKPTTGPKPRSSKTLTVVDPKSPTAFNTLSNVYVTAIERSTPVTAINTHQTPQLHIHTGMSDLKGHQRRIQTPYAASYPETPLTANPSSPSAMEAFFPSIMTATPPLSAGPVEPTDPKVFTFGTTEAPSLSIISITTQIEPRTPRRRATLSGSSAPWLKPPYSHPRSLHSILRNSPLPPPTAQTPMSPRRQSLRLQEKAARRVAYNSPIEQTIITNKYTKSHIDLLIDDISPRSPALPGQDPDTVLDLALAFTSDETRDGGQTPGPFEEMRRRMAGLVATTPTALSPSGPGGVRKRRKKEKKRRWVWTIGQGEDGDEEVGGAMAAMRAVEAKAASEPPPPITIPSRGVQCLMEDLPTPSVETFDECEDVEMADSSSAVSDSRGVTPGDGDLDLKTPTLTRKGGEGVVARRSVDRLGSVDLFNPETGSRRDTPVPPDMMVT
ncbi:hypothetical protein VD0002_g3881 [Verticillium dahliae]|uniref:Glucan 4-alpha-glucosidase n=2 Tax=Verticillium dahliae TaxID=27337 RepID=G2WWI6_VERDV|nr:uncharacterized protein VDAG_01972 [Verticillium dahliae VdLs.17]KAF3350060.1 CaiB/baiF CoA-transferase family protein C7orf10 [Verticillium dahliae VDG2]KAH6685566.1 hypothetical protein EV126DRAFT_141193 [Verticillium dahliae]EGY19956.1 hypothetical protein VDAG_01972 [Verticillium dahliae VdLs.17]PNH28722.1 hypothetical protein BJF96_g7945 [Verticillium dahliae]PNH51801.1 hypothetical protein VD0003_g5465 [Verticillium dahliae]